MNIDENQIRKIISNLLNNNLNPVKSEIVIPIESSARHVHLCQEDVDKLFGMGYKLTAKKELSQHGQYLCEERIKLITNKSEIANVAILGPARSKTQVEISITDARALGIKPPLRISGDLDCAENIFIMSDKKIIEAKNSVIIAQNHIHVNSEEADILKVIDGQYVKVKINSDRPIIFDKVIIRVDKKANLTMHIDFDEANACNFTEQNFGIIV